MIDKSREDQSALVQDLMLDLSNKYNEVFTPANASVEQTYLEGVENCVCKNLYSVLFGDNGVGTPPQPQQPNEPNAPVPATPVAASAAHSQEVE